MARHLTQLMEHDRAEEIAKNYAERNGFKVNYDHPWVQMLEHVTFNFPKLRESLTEDKYQHRISVLREFFKVARKREMAVKGAIGTTPLPQ